MLQERWIRDWFSDWHRFLHSHHLFSFWYELHTGLRFTESSLVLRSRGQWWSRIFWSSNNQYDVNVVEHVHVGCRPNLVLCNRWHLLKVTQETTRGGKWNTGEICWNSTWQPPESNYSIRSCHRKSILSTITLTINTGLTHVISMESTTRTYSDPAVLHAEITPSLHI